MELKLLTQKQIALISLISGAILIGAAPVFVRVTVVGPIAAAFWRSLFSTIMLFAFYLIYQRFYPAKPIAIKMQDHMTVIIMSLFFACDLTVWHISIHLTSVANSTMLANASPIFVALWGWIAFRRRPRVMLLLGLIAAIIGMAILINPQLDGLTKELRGDLFALIAAILYAVYLIIISRIRKYFPALLLMCYYTFLSTIFLGIFTYISGEAFVVHHEQWTTLILFALIVHTLGQGLIIYAMAFLPVTFSATALLIQPIVSAVLGWVWFNEYLALWQIIGIIITLLGIYLVKLGDRPFPAGLNNAN